VGLVLIFLGLLFWPKNKNPTTNTDTTGNKNISEPSPDFLMDSPKKINWNVTIAKDYSKVDALLVSQKGVDTNGQIQIRNVVSAGDTGSQTVFDFDSNRSSFEFSSNISAKAQIQRGELGVDEIKTSFLELENKLKEITTTDPKIETTNLKQFLKPWWVSSNGENIDSIEILANYYYNGVPTKLFNGYMIDAYFFTNGKLVKIQQKLPFDKVIKTENKTLLSLTELKNIDVSSFKIWSVDGGVDYELSGDIPTIDDVNITDYDLQYIVDTKTDVVWPYYFFHGESNLTTGLAKVTLIISAVKE
jgi:hypothetical protein